MENPGVYPGCPLATTDPSMYVCTIFPIVLCSKRANTTDFEFENVKSSLAASGRFFKHLFSYVFLLWFCIYFSHSRQESPSGFLFAVLFFTTTVVPIFWHGFAVFFVLLLVPGTLTPGARYFICFPLLGLIWVLVLFFAALLLFLSLFPLCTLKA